MSLVTMAYFGAYRDVDFPLIVFQGFRKLLRTASIEGKPYDLALLDVQMPEMDGLTLARVIKADPAIAGTRLIVLTSLGHAISAADLKKIGIDAYFVKPTKVPMISKG